MELVTVYSFVNHTQVERHTFKIASDYIGLQKVYSDKFAPAVVIVDLKLITHLTL